MERTKFQACANVLSLAIYIYPVVEIKVTWSPTSLPKVITFWLPLWYKGSRGQ